MNNTSRLGGYNYRWASTLARLYEDGVAHKRIIRDRTQEMVLLHMETLQKDLEIWYKGISHPRTEDSQLGSRFLSAFYNIFASKKPEVNTRYPNLPKGLYLYGSVGCGKTFLMDLFYETCSIKAKKRIHFHEFMQEIHIKWHNLSKKEKMVSLADLRSGSSGHLDQKIASKSNFPRSGALYQIAKDLVEHSPILCLDEFHVTHIGDAMLLAQLYNILADLPFVLIATSNRHPKDLYENGLQRFHFLPCIQLLIDHNVVMGLGSEANQHIDYRRLSSTATPPTPTQSVPQKTWLVIDRDNRDTSNDQYQKLWEDLSLNSNVSDASFLGKPHMLSVFGRSWVIKDANPSLKMARMSFSELCVEPRSASDYIALASEFCILFISDIPCMTWELRDEARRFITLLDILYEHKTKIVCSAHSDIDSLFQIEKGRVAGTGVSEGILSSGTSIFTGSEEIFASQRAISRLYEMTSSKWWV
jgi:protein AFG1